MAVLLALGVRLDFAFRYPIAQISDYAGYYQSALGLAGLGDDELSSWGPVAPPLLYALPLWLSSGDVRAIGVTNALLGAASALVFFLAAARLFGHATAWTALLVGLSSLSELFFNNLACSEVLATLFTGLLLLAMTAEPRPGRRTLWTGLVLGLSVYNRSNMITLVAAVAVVELLSWRAGWTFVPRTARVLALASLVLLPLCTYNLLMWGHFTPVTSNSGIQLWYGNNPEVTPGRYIYADLPEQFPPGSPERARLRLAYSSFSPATPPNLTARDPYVLSDIGARYALAWIRDNPRTYARLVVSRIRQLFERCTFGIAPYLFYDPAKPGQPRWRDADRRHLLGDVPVRALDGPPNPRSAAMRFSEAWYQALLGASLVGLLLTVIADAWRRHRFEVLAPLVMLVVYATPFVLSIALNRYHVPVLPLLWLYLARGIVLLFSIIPASVRSWAGTQPSHAG